VLPLHDTDPGEYARARRIVVVHSERGKRGELEKIGTGIEQAFHPLAGGELISPAMLFDCFGAPAGSHRNEALAQLCD
jgi:hypothetical protein